MEYEIIINHNFIDTDFSLNLTQRINLSVEYFETVEGVNTIDNIVNNILDDSGNLNNILGEFFISDNVSKKLKYTRKKFKELDKAENKCAICLENFKKEESVCLLDCDHVFHTHCIDKWGERQQNCPLCKKNIPSS